MWLLGPHRLMCGDGTNAEHVATLLGTTEPGSVDLLWTDPPYGVSYEGGTADRLTIVNDDLRGDDLGRLLVGLFTQARHALRPGGVFYVCAPSGDLETVFRLALREVGLALRQQIVWVKDRFVLSRQDYHGRHETILHGWTEGAAPIEPPLYDEAHSNLLYGWAPGAGHDWHGGRKQDTVWEHARPTASRLHPTMKPVELVARGIDNGTRTGDVVLDLCGGAGSAVIACHALARQARVMELDPPYVDVIARRYQEHTGTVPVLESTGEEHDFTGG